MSKFQLDSLAKALAADRAAFRAFADALPGIVWLSRADGGVVFLNEALARYTGLGEGEVPRLEIFMHPDDRQAYARAWQTAMLSGGPFHCEFRLCRANDAAYRWFVSQAQPIHDDDGTIAYWLAAATDVDEQKRAAENLRFVMDASESVSSASSVDEICQRFAGAAVRHLADSAFVVLTDAERDWRVASVAHRDPSRIGLVRRLLERYPAGGEGMLRALAAGKNPTLFPVISDDVLQRMAVDSGQVELIRELEPYSAIVAPLSHGGRILGALVTYSARSHRRFDEKDVEVLDMLAKRFAARISSVQTLNEEQHARQRLQFIGRATHAVYESFDLTTAFGNLTQVLVSEIGDMAAVFRLEENQAVRLVGAAHRDQAADDVVRSLIGIRVMHGEAERRFIQSLQARKPLVGKELPPGALAKSVWPYLSDEVSALGPKALVTVPLYSRGKVHGAIVVYYTQNGRQWKPDDVEMLVEIGRHASVALQNADVFERERRMSETLQDSLLPPSLPRVEGLQFDAVYLPSATEAQVGGDWYDAFELEDGTAVVSAGDVTGRGADAAVIMGKVRHLLAIAPCYERDPARILDTVESVLARRYPEAIVTAFLGFIDPQRKTITYANAGHPPPLLRRTDGLEELLAEGLPIGLRRQVEPSSSATVDLRDARMLVLYTDGLTEARHDVIGGNRRLREVVLREALLHTHRPARFIEEACLGSAVTDDVAVLTISFEQGMRWSFDAENAKAAQDARGEFVQYLRSHSGETQQIQTAELVFGELVGNVVRHAPGAIDIDLEWTNGHPTLHVLDRGPAFAAPGRLPDDLLSESGRGLFIVRNLTTALSVEHVPGYGNHVRAELPVRRKHK